MQCVGVKGSPASRWMGTALQHSGTVHVQTTGPQTLYNTPVVLTGLGPQVIVQADHPLLHRLVFLQKEEHWVNDNLRRPADTRAG